MFCVTINFQQETGNIRLDIQRLLIIIILLSNANGVSLSSPFMVDSGLSYWYFLSMSPCSCPQWLVGGGYNLTESKWIWYRVIDHLLPSVESLQCGVWPCFLALLPRSLNTSAPSFVQLFHSFVSQLKFSILQNNTFAFHKLTQMKSQIKAKNLFL